MGSGRSGAGGGGGGGSVTISLPRFIGGGSGGKFSVNKVSKEVSRALGALTKNSKEYLKAQFGSEMTRRIYEHLFDLNFQLIQNNSWKGIEAKYGISAGVGCLKTWANQVLEECEVYESNDKVRDVVKASLKDFLVRALGGNEEVFMSGNADDIFKNLRENVFKNTSGNFMSLLMWHMFEKQGEPFLPSVNRELQKVALDKSNSVIDHWFKPNFLHKKISDHTLTFGDFFRVVQGNLPSFLKEVKDA